MVRERRREVAVVAKRGQERHVRGERERGDGSPLLENRMSELHGGMLRVARAAAVTQREQPATGRERDIQSARAGHDALGVLREERLLRLRGLPR